MKDLYRQFLIVRGLHTTSTLFKNVAQNLKGKKHSSQLWLSRQIKDPYVEMAKRESYRCRSAYKLLEINERFKILHPGDIVIDCGAAPGSWTQVAIATTNSNGKTDDAIGNVFGIDQQPMYPIPGATLFGNMDFTLAASQNELHKHLKGSKANIVLSDMAPNASGIRDMDHENIMELAYSALKFALQVTKVNGTFLVKIWDGGRTQQLKNDILKFYKSLKIVKPQATRGESTEKFLLARGFKGVKSTSNDTT